MRDWRRWWDGCVRLASCRRWLVVVDVGDGGDGGGGEREGVED